MTESLGSGFDRIRAALMSPTNIESHIPYSPSTARSPDNSEPVNDSLLSTNTPDSPELPQMRPNSDTLHGTPDDAPRFAVPHGPYVTTPQEDNPSVTGAAVAVSAEWFGSDSEMAEVPESGQAAVSSINMNDNADLESFLPHFAQSVPGGNNVAITEDTENENAGELIQDYDSLIYDTLSSSWDESEDDGSDPEGTRKFYLGDNEHDIDEIRQSYSTLRMEDHDVYQHVFYQPVSQQSDVWGFPMPAGPANHDSFESEEPIDGDPHFGTPMQGSTHERNLTIEQFIRQWLARTSISSLKGSLRLQVPRPSIEATNVANWIRPQKIVRPPDFQHDFYDIQQIPWREKLRVDRADARALRDAWYTSYHNLEYKPSGFERKLPCEEFYFREKAMYTQCRATIEHFQLRNLMSVTSHNTVQFSHESRLYSWIPTYNHLTCLIDLSKPSPETGFQGPVKISTMKAKLGISIAGGFCGEYCMHVDGTQDGNVQGFVTRDRNGITNHIEIIQHRTNRSPVAVFASNDKHLRILDCETNIFVAEHALSRAINCTDTSSDGRLRVVIGDSPVAWVIEAETGRPIQPLRGHKDFGFACAWSPDMLHIATSNQDKTVKIWDVRTWRTLETIDSDVAGYRSLRFSPVGGGPRTLLMCEPADRISIVNAQTYQTRQVHDFFGEIGGADYTPDGSSIWVANTDEVFGGFMEFERRQWGQKYGLSFAAAAAAKRPLDGGRPVYYRDLPHEWVSESALEEDERCVLSASERRLRFLRSLSDEAHDNLLL
ncbi:hypothetical protein VTN77DRAFT_5096 [Rasamsonia byssochlamydoides]|uniref:uncharacterized protein n=1 Tax=Rasamsonia byssochlamydoides TaxID=89139 RepID=UPI0037422226